VGGRTDVSTISAAYAGKERRGDVESLTILETSPRLEKVTDGLFEGEETVLGVMGDQIASEKRRNPCTPRPIVIRGEAHA
jgi:hypothetical protein